MLRQWRFFQLAFVAGILVAVVNLRAETATTPVVAKPLPTPAQIGWQNAEVVAMFHFDPRIFSDKNGRQSLQHKTVTDPDAFAQNFNPQKLDTDQWMAAAKAMGATAAILVVKHETGFCLWQSDANPYCLKMLKWRDGKADILRDFIASCKKFGLQPGVFTESRWDSRLGVDDFAVTKSSPVTQAEYNRMVEGETQELCTRYGPLFELWFDGGTRVPTQGGPDVLPIVEQNQPGIIFYHSTQRADVRWCGTESGIVNDPCWSTTMAQPGADAGTARTGANLNPDGNVWCPAMADMPFRSANRRHDWFWAPGGERGIHPLADLQTIYLGSVGRNATLVVGLTPDRDGLVPTPDVTRCREWGDWINTHFAGPPLAATSGKGTNLTLTVPTDKGAVTYLVLWENIVHGENVRAYTLEAEQDGRWEKIADGANIGHKRIVPLDAKTTARNFRLRITQSNDTPEILAFEAR